VQQSDTTPRTARRPAEQAAGTKVELSPRQGEWMLKARAIARELIAPQAEKVDREGRIPRETFHALGRAGFMGLAVPERKGGAGADVLTVALVIEELAKACGSTAMSYHMHTSTVPLVAALVSDAQSERLLQPIIRGEWLGAIAMSEPGSGSRVWHTDSVVEEREGGQRINTLKSFVTNAGLADYYVVPLRSHAGARPDEISIYMLEASAHAIAPQSPWDAMGLRGTSSSPIRFEDVQVTNADRLGRAGVGFPMIVCFNLPLYHVGLSAVYLGIAEAALATAVSHAKKRVLADTGEPLSAVETVQRSIGEMRVAIDQTRALLHRVARLVDRVSKIMMEIAAAGILEDIIERLMREDDFFVEVAGLKASATETVTRVTDRALQICGGAGYKKGHPAERHYRDARAAGLMAPSDDAIKTLIGKQLLGYPFPWDERKG
jgi:alkylation response protein AidB-like acyl-CoA dehydrogenase